MASQVDTALRALGLLVLSVPVIMLVRAGATRGAHASTRTRPFDSQLHRNESIPVIFSRPVKHARHLKMKGKNRRRHHRRHSESSAVSTASTMQLEEDSGDRWRIRLPSDRFLYNSEGSIVASRHFFSLFTLRPIVSRPGVQLLSVHAGGWVAQINGTSQRLAVLPPAAPAEAAQLFWVRKRSSRKVVFGIERDLVRYLCEDAKRPGTFAVGSQGAQSACSTDEIEIQLVVDGHAPANQTSEPNGFEKTVRRSTMQVAGRSIVLATYHNVGMMHWATLFWGWLFANRIHKLLLLDLDGLTCGASRTLSSRHTPGLQIECATAADMTLGKQYILGKSASGVQDWGTRSNSGYFKFLRMKLRLVELVIAYGFDCVIADIDVLVLSPHFLSDMAGRGKDLVLSSDARVGKYNDNYHCPCSHPMYQRLTTDWVCAGLFYMRSTKASGWFIRQVQQYMDDFTITDQDAIQGLLTGHTQVAVPQVPTRRVVQSARGTGGAVSPLAPGFRPSGLWLKPLWLEELGTSGNLEDVTGIVPLNTPMRPTMWRRCLAKQRAEGFTWEVLPLDRYGNGPTMVEHWDSLFGPNAGSGADNQTGRQFRSIHANCNAKALLEHELGGTSVLTRPTPDPFGTLRQGVEFSLF